MMAIGIAAVLLAAIVFAVLMTLTAWTFMLRARYYWQTLNTTKEMLRPFGITLSYDRGSVTLYKRESE